jgi:hypothetical protein
MSTQFRPAADTMIEYFKKLGKSILNIFLRYPLACAVTVFLVVAAIAMAAAGKQLQIGGILAKLWGKKAPDIRGIPPQDRKDADGKTIQPGESDDKGFVQAPVSVEIKDPGIFGDPKVVTVVHPDKGEVKILLPDGVKNKDVKEVTEISPDIYEIKNHDSGVNTDDLLKTLGAK